MNEPSDFQQLVDACKAKAILGVLATSEASQWRFVCRTYSKTFNTRLVDVLAMDPEHVILNFFEEQMKDLDTEKSEHVEQLLEMIYELEDPDYANTKKQAQDEFDKEFEKQEADRVLKGIPIHPSLKGMVKNTFEKLDSVDEKMPTGGSLDTSMFNQDEES